MKYLIVLAVWFTYIIFFAWGWRRFCRMLDDAPKPQRRPKV